MKPPRVYIDTSVIGGCFDKEFAPWSNQLMRDFELGILRPVISVTLETEINDAPPHVRERYNDLVALGAEFVPLTDAATKLSREYQARNILGTRYLNDMLHIAIATVSEVDLVVSWNFKHIVRLDKIRLFNATNVELGYRALQIKSPREVVSDDQADGG